MRLRYRAGFGFLAAFCGLTAEVRSQEVPASTKATQIDARPLRIDVATQPVDAAINDFARQAGVHLVMEGGLAEGRTSSPVAGNLAAEEALKKLLTGTGLTYRILDERTIAVVRPTPTASRRPFDDPSAQGESRRPVRLAQFVPSSGGDSTTGDTSKPSSATQPDSNADEVVVVGSRLAGPIGESAQPVRLITRNEIDRSGATSVPQVLNMLPEVAFNSTGSTTQGVPGSTTVQLRGLPSGTALVLLNGRRIGSSSSEGASGYFNLGNIPLSMVERIEVLPTGSSAVYGGDGLSGVVNIVLRKTLRGVEATANRGQAEGYDETHGSLAWGHSGSRGSLMIIGSFDRQSELRGSERAITSTMDLRPFGGDDYRSQNTNPANIFSATAQNLPGLDSTFAAVPAGSTGVGLTPADFATTAGTLNLTSSFALNTSVYAPEERRAALMYGTLDVGSSIGLFTELLFSHADIDSFTDYPALQNVLVPAANPFNPFGVDVRANFRLDGVERTRQAYSRDYLRALFGARGRLGDWSWEATAWTSQDWQEEPLLGVVNSAAVTAALASTDPATALNVFQDGPAGSPQLRQSLLTSLDLEYHGAMQAVSATARGSVLELPAGPLEMAIGAEYEENDLEFLKAIASSGVDAGRNSRALFGELRVPLLKKRDTSLLTLTGAVRHDRYSDFGGRTSPAAGIEFRPTQSLLLRAAAGSSFKPPLLFHLYRPQRRAAATIFDPIRNETYLVPTAITGGNPDLEPQTGRSKTFGLVFSPTRIPGLDFSLTHWAIRLEDGAITPSVQYLTENEDRYPERIGRDASGRIVVLDRTIFNFGYIDEAGVDFTTNWRIQSVAGELTPSLSVTNTYHFDVQDSVGAPPRSAVGVVSAFGVGWAPRWKGLASLGWRRGPLEAAVIGRYVNEYRDGGALADGSIKTLGNMWHFDANARFELGSKLAPRHPFLAGTRVSIGVVNLFDKLPEFSNVSAGWSYDPSQYDIRGRYAYLQLNVGF